MGIDKKPLKPDEHYDSPENKSPQKLAKRLKCSYNDVTTSRKEFCS